ncbi:MAG: hypothetical protein ACKVPX_18490 [Myxococcaceae bacterium]
MNRDPHRPFRAAAYAVHATVVAAFCVVVIWSVVRSVRAQTPQRPAVVAASRSVSSCVEVALVLFQDLDEHRRALSNVPDRAVSADASWNAFRVEWVARLRRLEAECRTKERTELNAVLNDLEWLEGLHTTHAAQYAGEIGPTLERFERRAAALRNSPAR